VKALLVLAGLNMLVGCGGSAKGQAGSPPSAAVIVNLTPRQILPGSTIELTVTNLTIGAEHRLSLAGVTTSNTGSTNSVTAEVPLQEVEGRLVASAGTGLYQSLGQGQFVGTIKVISRNTWGETAGPEVSTGIALELQLTPTLLSVGSGIVFLNSQVVVTGDGMLLGGAEGMTKALLEGCFAAEGAGQDCAKGTGVSITASVPVQPLAEQGRTVGSFAFSPGLVGIVPGQFTGTLQLINVHPGSVLTNSAAISAQFDLQQSTLLGFDQASVSLGQYLDVRGKGLIGNAGEGTTYLRFTGFFDLDSGGQRDVSFDLVPEFIDGGHLRYKVNEASGIGAKVKLRSETGKLTGSWTPVLVWVDNEYVQTPVVTTIAIAPVKQVVWVRFSSDWNIGLRRFGLQAADVLVRRRIFDVLEQAYAGLNVEFRETEPTDFELYAIIDLVGFDPSGAYQWGYDNTPGKDVDNARLNDRIGGVNATTLADGTNGYGGVFIENFLRFSTHPPQDMPTSKLQDPLFDEIFDPFRLDQNGVELSSAEALAAPQLAQMSQCPASNRPTQAACAIVVLANLVGSTAAHELGHSLGLADPYGGDNVFHNGGSVPVDVPNALMDAGEYRPFAERAELMGQGPSVFCQAWFDYLKDILPKESPDPVSNRPACP
jgi:hypothetical protein